MKLGGIIKSLIDYVFNNSTESYDNASRDWVIKSIYPKNGYLAIEFNDEDMGMVYLDGQGFAYPNEKDEPDYAERMKYVEYMRKEKA